MEAGSAGLKSHWVEIVIESKVNLQIPLTVIGLFVISYCDHSIMALDFFKGCRLPDHAIDLELNCI